MKKIEYYLERLVQLLCHPYALYLRSKGVISDFYIKLDQPWFKELEIKTVLDVGGNVGRFSKTMQYLLPDAMVVAFEPIPTCHQEMNKLMAGYENFKSFNIGLGAYDEKLTINLNDHSPSSSFLELGDVHKGAFPYAAAKKTIEVNVETLDSIADTLDIVYPLMIKVDVQGFEDKVIAGGLNTFSKAKIVLIELSYQELYRNQMLFDDIYQKLINLGFVFYGVSGTMKHPATGIPLDSDCIFFNLKL